VDDLIDKLKIHFKPAAKALAERFRFMSRKQLPGESVGDYLASLRKLATKCKYKDVSDLETRLRDQFLFGVLNEIKKSEITERMTVLIKVLLMMLLSPVSF
jgi:hypothetical protein